MSRVFQLIKSHLQKALYTNNSSELWDYMEKKCPVPMNIFSSTVDIMLYAVE